MRAGQDEQPEREKGSLVKIYSANGFLSDFFFVSECLFILCEPVHSLHELGVKGA
jgi:hypothetical protein